ncbi:hypothetical protein Q3G72_032516 [Acer saccharum]|nr:hypothetical protein Q3G72_032516 [Acer saccharum]
MVDSLLVLKSAKDQRVTNCKHKIHSHFDRPLKYRSSSMCSTISNRYSQVKRNGSVYYGLCCAAKIRSFTFNLRIVSSVVPLFNRFSLNSL